MGMIQIYRWFQSKASAHAMTAAFMSLAIHAAILLMQLCCPMALEANLNSGDGMASVQCMPAVRQAGREC